MKRIVHMLAICAALLLGAVAVQADQPASNAKEHSSKAASLMRAMSMQEREAALAEMAGLLFMTDGTDAYSEKKGVDRVTIKKGRKVLGHVDVPFRYVKHGAQFIGSDGKLYDFFLAVPSKVADARKHERWKKLKMHIYRAGKQAVAGRFAEVMEEMEVQRGIYFLRQMPPELRQALFAEVLGLLYMDDGKDAYTGETLYSTISGERVPYQGYRKGARFVDAQGVSRSIEQVREEENKRGKAWRTWWPGAKLNLHRAGQERILAPFRAEIDAMRRHAAK